MATTWPQRDSVSLVSTATLMGGANANQSLEKHLLDWIGKGAGFLAWIINMAGKMLQLTKSAKRPSCRFDPIITRRRKSAESRKRKAKNFCQLETLNDLERKLRSLGIGLDECLRRLKSAWTLIVEWHFSARVSAKQRNTLFCCSQSWGENN